MKAFHTSNRALRNCWRMRLMWNVPVLPVMEYVCQRMPHTYARQSRMPRRPTHAARVLTVSMLAMSVRCTAVRHDLDTNVSLANHPGQRTTANSIPFPQDGSERPQSFCFRRSSGSGRWGRRSGAHSAQARVRRVLLLVSYSQKWRNAQNARFSLLWHSVACSRQQEDTYRQVGSARASHLAFIPIASQPRRSCLTSLSSCHCPVLCVLVSRFKLFFKPKGAVLRYLLNVTFRKSTFS